MSDWLIEQNRRQRLVDAGLPELAELTAEEVAETMAEHGPAIRAADAEVERAWAAYLAADGPQSKAAAAKAWGDARRAASAASAPIRALLGLPPAEETRDALWGKG